MYMYVYTCTYTYTCTYIHVHTCTYIHVPGLHLGGGAGGHSPPLCSLLPPQIFFRLTHTANVKPPQNFSAFILPPHHPFSKCNPVSTYTYTCTYTCTYVHVHVCTMYIHVHKMFVLTLRCHPGSAQCPAETADSKARLSGGTAGP